MQIVTQSPAPPDETNAQQDVPVFPTGRSMPFVLVIALFLLWGMSNNLTDILVQQFRKGFDLSQFQAQLVQFSVFLGYFCMAMPAALLMRRKGYKVGILAGLILFGTGMLLFWPAAAIGSYAPFLLALFVVGCGSATLETAANPFIAQFGPAATAARRLNFAQAFNPPGTITGVLLGTYFIFSGVELPLTRVQQMKAAGTYGSYLHTEILRVVPVYIALGCLVLFWAVLIARTAFPNLQTQTAHEPEDGKLSDLRHHPHLWFAAFAQFCYVGAQVATWSAFIPYVKQYTNLTERQAGYFLTGNLILLAVGRFVSTGLMKWFRPASMVAIYALMNIALVAYGVLNPGVGGAVAIMATSFFMSIMFPTIFALGVQGLGLQTKVGGALLVMSVIGGGIVPLLLGYIARSSHSLALGYVAVAAMYLVVALYGFGQPRFERGVSRTT